MFTMICLHLADKITERHPTLNDATLIVFTTIATIQDITLIAFLIKGLF